MHNSNLGGRVSLRWKNSSGEVYMGQFTCHDGNDPVGHEGHCSIYTSNSTGQLVTRMNIQNFLDNPLIEISTEFEVEPRNSTGVTVKQEQNNTGIYIDNNGEMNALEINQDGNLASARHALKVRSNTQQSRDDLVRFLQDHSSSTRRVLNVFNDGSGTAMIVDNNGNGVGLEIDSEGNNEPFVITANATSITCNYAGGIYYDGGSNKHYGCNGTDWNALY